MIGLRSLIAASSEAWLTTYDTTIFPDGSIRRPFCCCCCGLLAVDFCIMSASSRAWVGPDSAGPRVWRSDAEGTEDARQRLHGRTEDVLPTLRVDRPVGRHFGNPLRTALDALTLDRATHAAEGLKVVPCVHV